MHVGRRPGRPGRSPGRHPHVVAPPRRAAEQQHLVLGLRRPVRRSASSCSSSSPIVWSVVLSLYEARNTVSPTEFVGLRNYRDMLARPGVPLEPRHVRRLRRVHRSAHVRLRARARPARQPGRASPRRSSARCSSCRSRAATSSRRSSGRCRSSTACASGSPTRCCAAFGFEGRQWLSRPHPPLYWVVIVSRAAVAAGRLLHAAVPRRAAADPGGPLRGSRGRRRPHGWQTFRYITFPQLRATSAAVLVLLLINAFQAFDEFYNLLSNAGAGTYPPYARPPLVYLYYVALGRTQDFGHGIGGAVILTLIIAVLHPRPEPPGRLRQAGQLWLRCAGPAPVRSRQRAALYGVLTVAAILFLVPVLPAHPQRPVERPRDLVARLEVLPDVVAVVNVGELFDNRSGRSPRGLRNSVDRVGRADRRGRDRGLDGGLRPGPHPVPVRQRRVRHSSW